MYFRLEIFSELSSNTKYHTAWIFRGGGGLLRKKKNNLRLGKLDKKNKFSVLELYIDQMCDESFGRANVLLCGMLCECRRFVGDEYVKKWSILKSWS